MAIQSCEESLPGRLLLNIARGVIARIIPKRNDYLLGKYSADGLATSSFRSCEYSETSMTDELCLPQVRGVRRSCGNPCVESGHMRLHPTVCDYTDKLHDYTLAHIERVLTSGFGRSSVGFMT